MQIDGLVDVFMTVNTACVLALNLSIEQGWAQQLTVSDFNMLPLFIGPPSPQHN